MTLVAVISDYLLHPFYPQFFALRFGKNDPEQVGYYFAALCFMVMIAFPVWAYLSKKVAELRILVVTQCIAGLLALYCFRTSSYVTFWIVSLVMVLFKGSYLLMYPYILKIVSKEEHPHTIGVLSVVVHLGGIVGAVLGGLTVDLIDARYIFLIMASGDFIQMGMSAYLLKSKKYNTAQIKEETAERKETESVFPKGYILKIGLITMILYFSDFLIRPFFVRYWEHISEFDSGLISGGIYAIPGLVALMALYFNSKRFPEKGPPGIAGILSIGAIGLFVQGLPSELAIIVGRILYGWAIFQSVVTFDVILFKYSTPESYAMDYSKVHFFQNLGVLLSSFSVGLLVEFKGLYVPFYVAFFGFLLTLGTYILLLRTPAVPKIKSQIKNETIL